MDFIKNPQTTIALTFLTHIISGIDGVWGIPSSRIFSLMIERYLFLKQITFNVSKIVWTIWNLCSSWTSTFHEEKCNSGYHELPIGSIGFSFHGIKSDIYLSKCWVELTSNFRYRYRSLNFFSGVELLVLNFSNVSHFFLGDMSS